ncbi:MAG: LLM class flavin-dependent oxidoreductase [Candidatus Thorarchaeota archaeon]|nr:MAG: LLM class flavin-dependent oxidoreductase [Candidatus Thorarchaeota archaeon]
MKLKFGLALNVRERLDEILRLGKMAYEGAIDTLWVVDFPATRLAPVVASAIAHELDDMRLGIGLVSPFLHRPKQIVRFIESLVAQFGDRFDLLLGPGDISLLAKVGVEVDFSTLLKRMKTDITTIEEMLQNLGIRTSVLLGAQGPGLIRLSTMTDGVLLNYSDPKMIEWAMKRLGETSDAFQIGVFPPTFLTEKDDCENHLGFLISAAIVALGLNRSISKEFGLEDALAKARRAVKTKGGVDSEVVEILGKDTVRMFGLCGSTDETREYVRTLSKIGVDQIVFGPPLGTEGRQVELLANVIQ